MKKLIMAALLASGVSIPTIAAAQETFRNRGQCQSALVHARNDARKAGDTVEFDRLSNSSCVSDGQGGFVIDYPDPPGCIPGEGVVCGGDPGLRGSGPAASATLQAFRQADESGGGIPARPQKTLRMLTRTVRPSGSR